MASEIVQKWIQVNEGLSTIILSTTEVDLPISKSMIELIKCHKNYNNSKARKIAQQAFSQEGKCDKELFGLFILLWAFIAINHNNLIEGKNLLDQFDQIGIRIPEFIVFANTAKAHLKGVDGNQYLREKISLSNLKILDKKSAHYERAFLSYGNVLSISGRLKEIEIINFKIKDKRSKTSLEDIELLNFFTTYQLDKIEKIVNSSKKLIDYSVNEIITLFDLITLKETSLPKRFKLSSNKLDLFELWIASAHNLKKRNVEEALLWAKKTVSEKKTSLPSSNMFTYTLIREELSNKNISVAHKLMNEKVKHGNSHYLDDFFYARIELLKGNKNKASKLFKKSYEHCLYYSAIKRLMLELDLSCELLKCDIVAWLKENLLSKPKPYKLFKIHKPKNGFHLQQKDNLIGSSKVMSDLKAEINKFSKIETTILITGETGVGKEEVARQLHDLSSIPEEPFLVINCGAISDSLLHSELFGHRKGSFTGAIKDHVGIFEAAGAGTVLLDEIGEISERTQVALLRVLETKEVKSLGSNRPEKIKCKVLAATNKNLKELVGEGLYREDLYYRLNRLEINVPALRERGNDIIILAEHFLKIDRMDDKQPQLSDELKESLSEHSWPGNVRQLKNEVDKLRMIHSEKLYYDIEDFDQKAIVQTIKKEDKKESKSLSDGFKPKHADLTIKENMQDVIDQERTPLRRLEILKELFEEHNHLTRGEIIKLLKMSPGTITTDLKKLMIENIIEKIKPTLSPRTHYFQIKNKQ